MTDDKDEDNQLPDLNPRQFEYVTLRQSGKSKADAYRIAYNAADKPNNQVWVRAAEVESGSKVSVWMAHLKTEQISAATYTLEAHLADMNNIKELAIQKGNLSAATKAAENLGKACNHYTSNIEVNHTNKADKDLLQQLESLLGKDVALQAAQRMGYKDTEHKDLH